MSPDTSAYLGRELRRRALSVSGLQEKLEIYVRELEHWNAKLNLTALADEALVQRLILDPIDIGQKLQMSGTLLDVGSGNGSPGIPLHLACGLARTSLVEARQKRAAFLRHVANLLDGGGIEVYRSRLEDLEPTMRVDWISLQAVQPSSTLLGMLRRFSHQTTRVVWITSIDRAPAPNASRIEKEDNETAAWVFRLDQS